MLLGTQKRPRIALGVGGERKRQAAERQFMSKAVTGVQMENQGGRNPFQLGCASQGNFQVRHWKMKKKKEKRNSKNRKWISKVSKNRRDYMRVVLKMPGHSGTDDRNKNIKSEMMNKDGVGVGEG